MILCQKKLISVPELILARAFASIHLEKYSKATTTKQRLPGASGNGPTISKPNRCKGQVGMMDLVGLVGELCFFCKHLIIFACSHQLLGIFGCQWPIETLPHRSVHNFVWSFVCTAQSRVNFAQEFQTLLPTYAFEQGSYDPAPVQI